MGILKGRLWIRMTLVIAGATLLPLFCITLFSLHLLEQAAREETRQRHVTLAALSGALVRDHIERAGQKLSTMGKLLAEELDAANAGEWNADNQNYRGQVVSRLNGLVDPPGTYIEVQYFASGGKPQFVGVAQQRKIQRVQDLNPEFQQQEDSQITSNFKNIQMIDSLSQGRNNMAPRLNDMYGNPTVEITAPVPGGKGPRGAMIGYLDFSSVTALLDVPARGGYHVQLHDGDGSLLGESGEAAISDPSQTVPVGYADWTIRIAEPASAAFASYTRTRNMAVTGAVILSVLLTFAVILLSRHVVSPLSGLTRAAIAMESGDLSARSGIQRNDEVGTLAEAFDRMAASLEQLDSAKSAFMGNVSHELRTPLTSIRLSLANLADGIVGPLSEAQSETVDRLRREADRMIGMVNDLLELARLESGSVLLSREKIDLARLARETAASFDEIARQRQISLTVEGDGSTDGDPALLGRVLSNLVDNALKFTPTEGDVRISVGEGLLRISDTGPGLPEGELFDKFVQGTREGVKNAGVGLGLAIVRHIVDLHNGTVETRNEGGAVIEVRI